MCRSLPLLGKDTFAILAGTMSSFHSLYLFCSVAALLATSSAFENKAVASRGKGLRGLTENSAAIYAQARIIGGQSVNPSDDRYPFYTMMWGSGLCGGALITPSIVISAAHCLNADNSATIGISSRVSGVSQFDDIAIDLKVVHPDYSTSSFPNDIMVMKLRSPSDKQYVRLNRNEDQPQSGDELWVVGFGDTIADEGQKIPTVLNEVNVKYVDNDTCSKAHGGNLIKDDMLCASDTGKDSCAGDSGGPLIIKGDSAVDDILVGLVSWGRGCADSRYPGVYTRVSHSYDWIIETVCSLAPNDAPTYMNCGNVETPKPTTAPTFAPTSTPAPTLMPTSTLMPSNVPSVSLLPSVSSMPTASPTISNPPTVQPDVSSPPTVNVLALKWVGWDPPTGALLQVCEGDCDNDDECEGDLICFQRSRGEAVPGCNSDSLGDTTRDLFVDVCVSP